MPKPPSVKSSGVIQKIEKLSQGSVRLSTGIDINLSANFCSVKSNISIACDVEPKNLEKMQSCHKEYIQEQLGERLPEMQEELEVLTGIKRDLE